MADTVTVPGRFNGPPGVVNGGYACGLLASRLPGPAEVTLRRPVPVDTPLRVEVSGGTASVYDDGGLLAEAVAVDPIEIDVPAPVPLVDAEEAMAGYPAHDWGERMFPCFVCGPHRADGFRVFPGPARGGSLVAAVWRPDASLVGSEDEVPDVFAWAVLDCVGSWGAMIDNDLETGALLGRMSASIRTPARVGQPHVAIGWAGEADGRKLPAGSALFSADGDLLASARVLCFAPKMA